MKSITQSQTQLPSTLTASFTSRLPKRWFLFVLLGAQIALGIAILVRVFR